MSEIVAFLSVAGLIGAVLWLSRPTRTPDTSLETGDDVAPEERGA